MTQLIRYEAARQALADAVAFDEVMAIMNVSEQAALYAKQAGDNELIEKATEIRVRAQRKAGEMLTLAAEAGQRATGRENIKQHSGSHGATPVTLEQIGITKSESSRYQQLAAMPADHFETAVATAKATAGEVTTAFMLREASKAKPAPMKSKVADKKRQELREAQERGVSMLCTYARLTITALDSLEHFSDEERQVIEDLRTAIDRTSIIH